MLDLACGRGRNALFLADAGERVVAMDRDRDRLRELEVRAQRLDAAVAPACCDLETEHGIPVAVGSCKAILVFRFLFRPIAPAIESSLQPGGVLLYETFVWGHRETGRRPRRREFYLETGELPQLFPNLEVLSYREGPAIAEPPWDTAQLVARNPG